MKNAFYFFIAMLLVSACNQETVKDGKFDPYTSSLDNLEGVTSSSALEIRMTDVNGATIINYADLKPNTEYVISLLSKDAEFLRIKNGDGYQLLRGPSLDNHTYGRSEYRIITNPDFTDRIFINVVPLHHSRDKFIRERSQVFLMPGE
jgi:hypothetical protein